MASTLWFPPYNVGGIFAFDPDEEHYYVGCVIPPKKISIKLSSRLFFESICNARCSQYKSWREVVSYYTERAKTKGKDISSAEVQKKINAYAERLYTTKNLCKGIYSAGECPKGLETDNTFIYIDLPKLALIKSWSEGYDSDDYEEDDGNYDDELGENGQEKNWKLLQVTADGGFNPYCIGNVYYETGNICWGGNDYPETHSEAFNDFFTSPFNSDLRRQIIEDEVTDSKDYFMALEEYSKEAKATYRYIQNTCDGFYQIHKPILGVLLTKAWEACTNAPKVKRGGYEDFGWILAKNPSNPTELLVEVPIGKTTKTYFFNTKTKVWKRVRLKSAGAPLETPADSNPGQP